MGLPTRVFIYGVGKAIESPGAAIIVGTAAWHARNWTIRVIGSILYRQTQANTRLIQDIWRHTKKGNEPFGGRANPYWKRPARYLGAAALTNPGAAGFLLATAGAIGAHQSMSNLGSGIRIGEIQPIGAVAPSHHLVDGRPWWE